MDPKAAIAIPEAGGRSLEPRWVASREANLALSLERSARLSLRLGDEACRPRRRGRKAPPAPFGLSCGLYRQSAYYSLRALSLLPSVTSPEAPRGDAAGEWDDIGALLRAAPPALLERAAGGGERAAPLLDRLREFSFVDYGEAEPADSSVQARELGAFARVVLHELEAQRGRLERRAASRSLWLVALVALAGVLAGLLLLVPEWWAAHRDLAAGKPWAASSTWGGGCESPLQECPGDGNYFIHTQTENEPWFELDLRSPQTFSAAQVVNRLDCCNERAVPLILEVSNDHQKWREVVRSTQPFREWKPSFAPVSARWVRLRVPKYVPLHLKRVRILP